MATNESVPLRIFSLNCWGLRYVSKNREERMVMIGDKLSRENHDIVLLQEVWSEKDFLYLKKTLSSTHPHSYNFKSGVIGSGLAVFSRHRILDVFFYRFSVNGYPYMIHQGDWFGGKAVGMVQMKINGLMAHVYVTHFHAEYCRERDIYLPHRVVQAWELQQFIRHTSRGADLVIVGGDLNTHPQDLGCRLVRAYTGLRDSYTETGAFDGCENGLTLIAKNPYVCAKELGPFEEGIRIDYILFRGSKCVEVKCESLSITQGSCPGQAIPLSDHEALSAQLLLVPTDPNRQKREPESSEENTGKLAELVDLVTEARTEVKVGVHCAERQRHRAARTGAMGLALLLLELAMALVPWLLPASAAATQPFPRGSFCLLGALCFCLLLLATLLWVFHSGEIKALRSADDHMRLAAASLLEEHRGRTPTPVRHAHGDSPANQHAGSTSKED
ncbi:sphingomyelin phosphodiesterase 2 [Alosa pseudoharengus]|uniref:sphingomyelin phosphodiesterase 2 n=1 Tax=Alosa pseudoharengus TaxID=34774 RepID=UPI003F895E9A